MQARQARFQDIVAQVRAARARYADCGGRVISRAARELLRSRRTVPPSSSISRRWSIVFQHRPRVAANAGAPPIFAARHSGPGALKLAEARVLRRVSCIKIQSRRPGSHVGQEAMSARKQYRPGSHVSALGVRSSPSVHLLSTQFRNARGVLDVIPVALL